VNINMMPQWQKSSFCGSNACVEIAATPHGVLLRDSKNPDVSPFVFTADEWSAFIKGVQAGEFTQ
jgi:uncharacterized protein DUF397